MNPVLNWMIFGFLGLVIIVFVLNWVTGGFILRYLPVKGSRGGKKMVVLHGAFGSYLRVGKVQESWLVFKKRGEKNISRLPAPAESANVFYNVLGVGWCDVDEVNNVFFTRDARGAAGFDSELQENLYLRALWRQDVQNKLILILIIGFLVVAVGLLMIYSKVGKLQTGIEELKGMVAAAKNVVEGVNL